MSLVRFVLMSTTVLALAGTASQLAAQATPPPAQPPRATTAQPQVASSRIAFINAGALLRGMPGYAAAESLFTREATQIRGEADKLRAAFDSSVATYQQSQAMMTPSNRTARERQLQAQGDSLQAKLQALQAKLGNRQQELMAPMEQRLRAIIEGVRAEENIALIIDIGAEESANIITYDRSLDITLRIAQRLAQAPPG
ncbi:MAG: OmpH family outer membrane protein [Gemmatimonadales bacterium]|nr:OmpH family outer membrane protein [Gemmatimonadales bacterium]